jgi:hypothetical protein
MRGVLAALLLVHGFAHTVGFVVPWRLVTTTDVPYRTTLLGGVVDVGDAGIRAIGLLWLTLAVACVVVAGGLLAGASWWFRALLPLLAISSLLCALQWSDARLGLLANAVILALLVIGMGMSGLTVP